MKTLEFYTRAAETALQASDVRRKLNEVLAVLREVRVPVFRGKSAFQDRLDLVQPVLNVYIEKWLALLGWSCQTSLQHVIDEEQDRGSLDFLHMLPDGRCIALEVQLGNGGRLERDIHKFGALQNSGKLALAIAVYFDRKTATTADSGLAAFETAVSRTALHGDLPLCIFGASRDGAEEVDLAELSDIVFPSVLGGKGKGKAPLFDFLGDALLDGKDLAQLKFPPDVLAVVRRHAVEHVEKTLHALQIDVGRIACARNASLRTELQQMLTQSVKNSVSSPAWTRLIRAGTRAAAKERAVLASPPSLPVQLNPRDDTPAKGAYRVAKATFGVLKGGGGPGSFNRFVYPNTSLGRAMRAASNPPGAAA